MSVVNARQDTMKIGAWGLGNSLLIPAYGIFAILVVFRATPEGELGAYLVLQAIYLMIVQLARNFGYTPLVRHFFEEERRGAVVGSSTVLTVLFQVAALGLLIGFRHQAAAILGCPPLPDLIWLVAAAVLLGAVAELRMAIFQALHHTRQVFLINAVYHVTLIGVIAAHALTTGAVHAGQLLQATVWAAVSSSVASAVLTPRGFFGPRVSRGELRRMYEYGKYTLGTSVSAVVFTRVDVVILSAFRSPAEVAAYGVGKVFVRLFDIYHHTAALVLFPLFCRLWSQRRREELRRVYRRLLVGSTAACGALAVGLALVAIPMVRFFYGGKYPSAGPLLAVLSLTGLTVPWTALAQNLINAAGVPSFVFGARIAIAGLNLVLDIILIRQFGAYGAALATLISLTTLAVFMNRKASGVFSFDPPERNAPHDPRKV
ncbi:oligosaccharide flippase family protein [Candidatus Fermentibacteria bacterium]|nr:oligosaccharide flippase family protein [Candidatus Fermentibacteria bacterium]